MNWKSYVLRLRDWFTRQSWEVRVMSASVLISLAAVVALSAFGGATPQADGETRAGKGTEGVDTFIPKGFVLVPIEVVNYEALDSILGKFGIVDLLTPNESGGARPVARNVRILRAPRNPSHFAVLIKESDTQRILRHGSSFHVLIKRPGAGAGTEFVNESKPTKRKIIYGGGP